MGEFREYVAAWRERWRRERELDAEAAKAARAIAERLAELLGDRYGAGRVFLTGSLARGEFRRDSDIDLAVEGVPAGKFFRAGADLEAIAEGFEVDLVPLESASPRYVSRLEREGIVLHESRRT